MRQLDRDAPPRDGAVGDHPGQGPLEGADVGRDAAGDEREHLRVVDLVVVGPHALLEDGDAGLDVGRLDVGDEADLEPAPQAVLQGRDRLRRAVERMTICLPAGRGIERVEELLLRLLAALQGLDVVDQEDVRAAVAVLERADAAVAQGVDELVGERLDRDVGERELGVVGRDEVPDRVQEVGLAEAEPAVDEEGVVGAGRRPRRPRARPPGRSGWTGRSRRPRR